jgi:hypothetical protein
MRKWLIGAVLAVTAYIGYPYLTLWWIDHALLNDDKAALESLVDWPLVRQQLKADVKLALIESAQTEVGKDSFAGLFGAALTALLVPTLVDSAVDDWVTPLMRLTGSRWRVVAIKLPPVNTWLKGSAPRVSAPETPPVSPR